MKLAKMPDGTPEIYGPVLQGEGPSQGQSVIFVRLSGCNLYCSWCDSFYTWNFEGTQYPIEHEYDKKVSKEKYVLEIKPEDVSAKIIDLAGQSIRRIVFTGGEPLMQQDSLIETIKLINSVDENIKWVYEIETNGTIKIKDELLDLIDQINCSPKLRSSGNKKEIRTKPKVIEQYYNSGKDIGFKFVIRENDFAQDLCEVQDWQKENNISSDKIYLMPEGLGRDEIVKGTCRLESEAFYLGYNITTRLHVLLHGDKRAV